MSYVRLTDAQTAAKHFLTQVDMRQLRDNQDDHEARIAQFLAYNVHSISEHFFSSPDTIGGFSANTWPDDGLYVQFGSSAQLLNLMVSTGEHVAKYTTNGSVATVGLQVLKTRSRLRFNQDMAFFFEVRAKDPGAAVPDNIQLGLTDEDSTGPADESDVIGWHKGSSAGKWRFRVATGGVQTETDNIGNRATWQTLRFEGLRSGGGATLQVKAFIDGAEISGSPFTTNIPTSVILAPTVWMKGTAAGITDLRLDKWALRWTADPIAA